MNNYHSKTPYIGLVFMVIISGTLAACSNDDTEAGWDLVDEIAQDLCVINEPDQVFVEVPDDDPFKGDKEAWKRDFPSVRYGCGEYQARLTLIKEQFSAVEQPMDWYMWAETRVCNRCEEDEVLRILDMAYARDPNIDRPEHDPDDPTATMTGFAGYIGVRDQIGNQYLMSCGGDGQSGISRPSYRLTKNMAIPPNKMYMKTYPAMVHPVDLADANPARLFYYDHPVDYSESLDWVFYWMKLYSRDELSREGEETVWDDILCGPEFIEDDETRADMADFRARLFEVQQVDEMGFPEAFETYLHSKNFTDGPATD